MNKNENKMHIMEAAAMLFMEKGVDKTSLSEISKKAGISKGTLYYHFPSKNDLILAITDAHISLYTEEISEMLANILPGDDLTDIVNAFYELFLQADFRSRLQIYLINEAISGNEILRQKIVEIYTLWKNKIKFEIDKIDRPLSEHKDIIGELLLASLDGWILQSALGIKALPVESAANFIVRKLMDA